MGVMEVTDKTFQNEVLDAATPVLVDFWAPWCMPCRMQAPILETVANKIGDKAKIVKLNTDDNTSIAQKYRIMSIPTLVLFKEGEIVEQMVGVQGEDILVNKLSSVQ